SALTRPGMAIGWRSPMDAFSHSTSQTSAARLPTVPTPSSGSASRQAATAICSCGEAASSTAPATLLPDLQEPDALGRQPDNTAAATRVTAAVPAMRTAALPTESVNASSGALTRSAAATNTTAAPVAFIATCASDGGASSLPKHPHDVIGALRH